MHSRERFFQLVVEEVRSQPGLAHALTLALPQLEPAAHVEALLRTLLSGGHPPMGWHAAWDLLLRHRPAADRLAAVLAAGLDGALGEDADVAQVRGALVAVLVGHGGRASERLVQVEARRGGWADALHVRGLLLGLAGQVQGARAALSLALGASPASGSASRIPDALAALPQARAA
jgi:hypothetical protein